MNTQSIPAQGNTGLAGPHSLPLVIEGKSYNWHQQYISGAEIRKLAGLPPLAALYLAISNPWKDEPIADDQQVDLARPGIEQFYVKRPLNYFIGEKEFQSESQYISGAQIRRQGDIPADFEIFLSIDGPWEDERIEDSKWVDLARPGIEHFYSCKPNTTNG